jgi:hypothetical protein
MTNTRPNIPFHTDQASLAARQHDGQIPRSWNIPDTPGEGYAKTAVIAAVAWEASKPVGDPPFPACTIAHRESLIAEVEALLKSGPPNQSVLTPFLEAALAVIDSINQAERLQLPGDTDTGDN